MVRFVQQLPAVARPVIVIDTRQLDDPGSAVAQSRASLSASAITPARVLVLTDANSPLADSLTLEDLALCLQQWPDHWWLWLPAGCRLHERALPWLMSEGTRFPQAALVYSDHDYIGEGGRRVEPQFKPDWAPEFALASGYSGGVLAVRPELLTRTLRDYRALTPYALLLAAAEDTACHVRHVPHVLWHQPLDRAPGNASPDPVLLERYLSRTGRNAKVRMMPSGHLEIRDYLGDHVPLVSVVVPTRDRIEVLEPCIRSLLKHTDYPNFELMIIDNQSEEAATHRFLNALTSDPRVRVLPYGQPFNFSAINNFAAAHARGEFLCLLNNDTEVVESGWLAELVASARIGGVGVVGCQLRYPDGTLQHAGDLISGAGGAHHLHGRMPADATGYMHRIMLRQEVSAVTAACLLTPRELFLSAGGMDAEQLPVAYNDVDYCLRLGEMGYRVIYTPYARLIHHESVSRGRHCQLSRQQRRQRFLEAECLRTRWQHRLFRDPFYNPNLNYYRCDFSLDPWPDIRKPWG
jgi:GT2 family glycosyltransferase